MVVVVLWIVCAVAGALLAQERTGEAAGGFLLGFLLGPIGLLIILARKPTAVPPVAPPTASMARMRRCPDCAELIQPTARICRFCRAEVAPGSTGAKSSSGPKPIVKADLHLPTSMTYRKTAK